MGRFDTFIYVSVILFNLLLIFVFHKNRQYREKFENVYHVTSKKDYNFDKIIVNPDENDTMTYDNDGLYVNNLYVTSSNKLFVGNSAENETSFTLQDCKNISNTKFPYKIKTKDGERLYFNKFDNKYYLDANHLRALQGKQLIPLYNKRRGVNTYALKLEAEPFLFETDALKCGFKKDAVTIQGNITGLIPENNAY